jgi:hypothetical protein
MYPAAKSTGYYRRPLAVPVPVARRGSASRADPASALRDREAVQRGRGVGASLEPAIFDVRRGRTLLLEFLQRVRTGVGVEQHRITVVRFHLARLHSR